MMKWIQDSDLSMEDLASAQQGFNQFADKVSEIHGMLYPNVVSLASNPCQSGQNQIHEDHKSLLERNEISNYISNGYGETMHSPCEKKLKKKSPNKNYERALCSIIRPNQKIFYQNAGSKKNTNSIGYSKMFWEEIEGKYAHPSLKTLKKYLINPESHQHKVLDSQSSKFQIKFVNFLKYLTLQQVEVLRRQTKERILSAKEMLIVQAGKKKKIDDPIKFVKYVQRFLENLGEDKFVRGGGVKIFVEARLKCFSTVCPPSIFLLPVFEGQIINDGQPGEKQL